MGIIPEGSTMRVTEKQTGKSEEVLLLDMVSNPHDMKIVATVLTKENKIEMRFTPKHSFELLVKPLMLEDLIKKPEEENVLLRSWKME